MSDDLTFLARCAGCGAVIAVVPVEENRWQAAEAWCYLAHRSEPAHECENR